MHNEGVLCTGSTIKTHPASTTIIAIICPTAVIIVVIVAASGVMLKKKRGNVKKPEEEKELNKLYKIYYRGREYNTATDDNPRYDEDGDSDNAVVTDQHTYNCNPGHNEV